MYKVEQITPEAVCELLGKKPGLKQSQILDELRGPLEYDESGCVIPRQHDDLPPVLKELRRLGRIDFLPKGSAGGWRLIS